MISLHLQAAAGHLFPNNKAHAERHVKTAFTEAETFLSFQLSNLKFKFKASLH